MTLTSEKNIVWMEISIDLTLLMDKLKCNNNLADVFSGIIFAHQDLVGFVEFDYISKTSSKAKFTD